MGDEELRIERRPEVDQPVLIASFRGWNDGGQGASRAGSFLASTWGAEQFAEIDPEGFFDFQMSRPHVSLEDGRRRIDWPENSFHHARVEGRDMLLLLGTEPSLRWRSFTRLITGLATDLGVSMVVTLGALLADVPHTRPAPVTASASDQRVLERLGLQPSSYQGPTGMVGVLHDACNKVDIPSVSLWAAVPHYVQTPSPRAAQALCDRLSSLLDLPVDTSKLAHDAEEYVLQVNEAVASDQETAEYVEELESRVEELDEEPDGETLAAELTRFLREREQGGGEGTPPPSAQ
jgi:predicted ATP-grasp superfamily ATP-dependent carboligase